LPVELKSPQTSSETAPTASDSVCRHPSRPA
jgi:hypothetical protein